MAWSAACCQGTLLTQGDGRLSTDREWQIWGERDPYFAVLTHDRFRRQRLTPESLDEFFRIGRAELAEILADCRRHVGEFSTRRTLDFGCGVGRLLIPLAEVSESCVGADISDAMRAEALRNCMKFGRENVRLVKTLDELGQDVEPFSFISSYIVLQHIEPRRGLGIIAALLGRLAKGGAAALHVTYARRKYAYNLGAQPPGRRMLRGVGRQLSRLAGRVSGAEPEMRMHPYDLNRVLFLCQQHGVQAGGFRFTDHAANLGALLYLKRD